jgi:Putative prokaryotic signal transducing protein
MKEPNFAAYYADLAESELVKVGRAYDSLVEDAQTAIRAEFARRGLEAPLIEGDGFEGRTLVTVSRYRDLSEAIVARSLLESAGISVFLQDENLVRLDWQVSNFIGGIRLKVDAENEASARELLSQPIPDPIEFAEGAEFEQPHCPRCGSTDITFEGSERGAALTALYVVGVPLPKGRKTWRCNVCEARWEDTEDEA